MTQAKVRAPSREPEVARYATDDGRFALVARLLRNGLAECWHFGAAAVVTPGGRLVARLGDAAQPAFLRSAAKPFQALPLLEWGGVERFALEPADVALVCASHSGTEAHVERVEGLLARGGFTAEDLQCGVHRPYDASAAERLAAAGRQPTPLHHNCSGKHAGFLLACRARGLDAATYLDPEHPLQRAVRVEMERFSRAEPRAVECAVDGCSAPTFRLPLAATAAAYAALADPGAAGVTEERRPAVEQVVAAMTGVPEMVAGPGRFTTRLMEVTAGRLLAKEGAGGFYAVAVRGPVALGVALKIADGSEVCRDGVVLDLLRQLGSLSAGEFEEMAAFHRPPVKSQRGVRVGEVVPDVELREVEAP